MKGYQTLAPLYRRHSLRILLGLLSLIICDFFQLVIPRVVKYAVDHLSSLNATPSSLALAGAAIVGLAFLIGIFRYIWRRLIIGFSRLVEKDVRGRLHAKLLTMTPAWFLSRPAGDIMAHATNDLEAVRMASGIGMVAVVDALVMGTASIGFMAYMSPKLTLLALIPMPLIPILTRYLGAMMHRRHRAVQDTFGLMTGQAREFLSGIRVVKAHVREDLAIRELDKIGQQYVKDNVSLNKVTGAFFPLMIMISNLSVAILIYYGGRMTILGTITPGDFVAFISYLGLLTWPMMALGWVVNLVQRGAAALDRINQVLNEEPEISDPAAPIHTDSHEGAVEIKGLTYTYPGSNGAVFTDMSLNCPAGRITALVGRTGSGKTTVLNLILRLFDPPPETVFLDRRPVETLSLSDLRGLAGYVPQDGYIFSGTLAENISFGRPGASREEIEAAAEAAELLGDAAALPQGLDTMVGERGVTLSGGQKQRLALARALILDPPLLIMDDTLSAVDSKTEEKILGTLVKVRAGKTTIIASHRVTSLKIADLIHVIEEGRVTETGRHEDLIAQDGYYSRMYYLQQIQNGVNRAA